LGICKMCGSWTACFCNRQATFCPEARLRYARSWAEEESTLGMLTPRQPSKNRLALTLAGIIFSTVASQTVQDGALGPLLATALAQRSVRPMWVGVVVGAPSISIALLSPFSAKLYKNVGPRVGLSVAAFVTIACLLSYPLVERTSGWFLLSLIVGFAMAVRWVMGETWLITSAPGDVRGRAVGIQEICIGLANAAGQALIATTGSSGRTPFLACAAVMAGAGFIPLLVRARNPCADLVRVSKPETQTHWPTAVRLALASAFVGGALETGAHAFLPMLVLGKLWEGSSPLFAASVFSLGAMASQLPLGVLTDRIGSERIHLKVSVLLLIVGCALAWTLTAWIGCLFIFLGGACTGCLYTLAVLSIAASSKQVSAGIAKITIAYTLGGFVGPVTIGTMVGVIGAPALGCTVLASGLGLLLVQYCTKPLVSTR